MRVLMDLGLTKREVDVALLVVSGMISKQIADHLGISEKGIKNHLTKIYRKVGVKSRTQLTCLVLGKMNAS